MDGPLGCELHPVRTGMLRPSANTPRIKPLQDHYLETIHSPYRANDPSSSSIRRSWLYLAIRSCRLALPVLICPALVATAMSEMVVSSVSPERWLMTVVNLFRLASSIASNVSVRLPIWLTFTRMLFPQPFLIPSSSRLTFVTNRSSPPSWIFAPNSAVNFFHPSQSSSDSPSSIDRIGHLAQSFFHRSIISSDEMTRFLSLLKTQYP